MVIGFLVFSAASASANTRYGNPKSPFESRVDLALPETVRIRAHLAQVEADLRAHPPQGLRPEQAQARTLLLGELHAYWVKGEFPRNPDYPDSLVPYFIDDRGVACAVGHLVIASGHRDFAEHIARTRNHAYIREIADPRLAEWAEASGLTLEECARIQPSYGEPLTFPYIRAMEVSSQGEVWTVAEASCLCSPYTQVISQAPGGGWKIVFPERPNPAMLCLDPGGRPLIGFDGNSAAAGLLWQGKSISGAGEPGGHACDWAPDGSMAWVAGDSGLRGYRLTGSDLSPLFQLPPRDSMFLVATSGAFVWSATRDKAYGGMLQGSSALNKMDSAGRSSFRITGMAGQGRDMLWAGLGGVASGDPSGLAGSRQRAPVFSREGLLFRRGFAGPWTVYDRAGSGLPSDTILALAPADSPSAWIATAGGIFKFTPPGTVSRILPALEAPVTDLETDSLGRLYIATWGKGVYRYEAGTSLALGYYALPSPILPDRRKAKGFGKLARSSGSDPIPGYRLISGRKAGPSPAAGLFVSPVP